MARVNDVDSTMLFDFICYIVFNLDSDISHAELDEKKLATKVMRAGQQSESLNNGTTVPRE